MNKQIVISTILASTVAFGGTHGGGVMRQSGQVSVPKGAGAIKGEWIRYIGQDRNEVVFEYGQQNEKNELYTTVVKMRPEEFTPSQAKVQKAIDESLKSKDWKKVD